MTPIAWELPPLVVGCAVMMVAAAMQAAMHRVPNLLTLAALALGLFYAGITQSEGGPPQHALVSSIACIGVAFTILFAPFAAGWLGAGCVKSQMAFAAWIGASAPLLPAVAVVAFASVTGLAVTFVAARQYAAALPQDEHAYQEFPAQVTLSAMAIVVAMGAVTLTCAM